MAASRISARMMQNFHLVWLDGNMDEDNADYRHSITKLRQVVNTINTFVDPNECIRFINSIKEEATFMISSGALGQTTVPVIHDKSQVDRIYIFCGNKTYHEKWAKDWRKIKGVFSNIEPICKALRSGTEEYDYNNITMNFVRRELASNCDEDNTALDCSFMYTQILKEILVTIEFTNEHITSFLSYCREHFAGNKANLEMINNIKTEYPQPSPIWWYTCESFLYSMLNRALRTMEIDLLIQMGFFLRDLHNQIARLHAEQFIQKGITKSFVVYRGQGVTKAYFEQLKQSQDQLISFNSFLSTTEDTKVSFRFARTAVEQSNLIGIHFVMTIDPNISTTPFAHVRNISFYKDDHDESEILFSMHSVFRIGQIKRLTNENNIWQVDLTLTSNDDQQLKALTQSIRKETSSSYKGWYRLGKLLIKMGQLDKAEELFEILLKQTSNEREQGFIYYQLGWIKDDQEKYREAIEFYEKSLEIEQKYLPSTHPDLAASYNNIGTVYKNMNKYKQALSYYQKVLEIQQMTLSTNHPNLATTYSNIGAVYDEMNEYEKALEYYEKDLAISKEALPESHPDLAASYNNIGNVYNNMNDFKQAYSCYTRAFDIWKRSLPTNHPHVRNIKESIENVKKKL